MESPSSLKNISSEQNTPVYSFPTLKKPNQTIQSFSTHSPHRPLSSSKFEHFEYTNSSSFLTSDQNSPSCYETNPPVYYTENPERHSPIQKSLKPSPRRVLIIGAGCSGLAAIKSCLDEGLEPVCLESSSDIGGLWNYKDNDVTGNAGIYRSLVINTSKEMMMFSDFPPPESFPPFLTHEKVLEYFRLYADHFGLLRYIRFGAEVIRVSRAEDYETKGRWKVEYVWGKSNSGRSRGVSTDENHSNSDAESDTITMTESPVLEVFDGVMICTGHHSVPYIPEIPGLGDFRGQVLHSRFYKESAPFLGKRVVILGMGNSAVDIACDLAKSAKQVYLCSRRGSWIVPRTSFWGLPADMLANSRVVFTLPYRLLDWLVQVQANLRVDHAAYGLRPQHGVLNCHPTINDELPIHLVSGRVLCKPSVARVRSDSVVLDDGVILPCDVIIMATGYDYRVDFVDPEDLKVENNQSCLYKFMVPLHHSHPTLTVIGLIQAIGAAMPISEMQTRWAAKLITGAAQLPSQSEMQKDYDERKSSMAKLYVQSRRHSMQTFWIEYMDQIASKIGAKPNLWKLLLLDPELAVKCYLGPCLPAQYRLVGEHTWSGAREFILRVFTRAFRSRRALLAQSQPHCNRKPCQENCTTQNLEAEIKRRGSNSSETYRSISNETNLRTDRIMVSRSPQSFGVSSLEKDTVMCESNGVEKMPVRMADERFYGQLQGCQLSLKEEQTESTNVCQTFSKEVDLHIIKDDIISAKVNGNIRTEFETVDHKSDGSLKRPSPVGMTFTFYIWALLVCCIAWGISHLFSFAEESLVG